MAMHCFENVFLECSDKVCNGKVMSLGGKCWIYELSIPPLTKSHGHLVTSGVTTPLHVLAKLNCDRPLLLISFPGFDFYTMIPTFFKMCCNSTVSVNNTSQRVHLFPTACHIQSQHNGI